MKKTNAKKLARRTLTSDSLKSVRGGNLTVSSGDDPQAARIDKSTPILASR